MIKGKIFIDLEPYIDLRAYDKLHLEICRGIATARDLALDGLQHVPDGTMHPHAQGYKVYPLFEATTKWESLSEDDPFKIAGKDLTYNQRTDYLKNAYGAYDFYRLFPILGDKGLPGKVSEHFPNLTNWVLNLENLNIFKSFHSSNLISVDAGGIPWEHFDPPEGYETPGFLPEFIHIKTDCDRPFYILDPETNERTFMNTRVAYWNERDWHGGLPIYRPTYTLRINGSFTEEFKEKTGMA